MIRKWIKDDDKELQKFRAEEKAFFKDLDENIGLVKANLKLEAKELDYPGHFHLLQTLPEPQLYESLHYSDEALPVQCLVLRYITEVRAGRQISRGEDFYLFGLITLKKTYPHTLIYPETLAEILSEIFVKTELDFKNNKKFSRRFYTVTKDKEALTSLLYDKSLDDLSYHKELELELKDNHCIFRQGRKPISRQDASTFCELAQAVHKTFD